MPNPLKKLPLALPLWSLLSPLAAVALLLLLGGAALSGLLIALVSLCLIAAVLAAVHHAEVVAHRVGEPYGSLVLAVAVTIIEVALIVSLMLAGGESANALARDTVFSAIMIVCNGVVGLCILVGGMRHRVLAFRIEGTSPTLAVLAALSTLTLVLPAFTTSTRGPTFSQSQLMFAGVVSLVLYAAFVFVQAVRHRDYFLPAEGVDDHHAHAAPPGNKIALASLALLMVCLVGVVGLAKLLAPSIENAVRSIGAPSALVGVIVALLVLAPETLAAVRAAMHNRLQTSLNLALGSGLASIGLTIPAVAVLSLFFPHALVLGLEPVSMVLLLLTFVVGTLTLGAGRATVLQGAVHLVLFAVFLFLAVVP
ncbi:ionic transporter y4hA [Paucibacter sp. PLA-PC-4]|uniref:calcium:proton antiporter n=1 Tax=Paucibacter sp. PLA-PC-4 TaxID=2993655 RepID=UPI002249559E|nr:ionic transporter y4hA [Paucibacter sp. PLA-PC-4]MCX2862934.1 ionic transporter y4hA [Paucibacter sp. PLA-PC-4]